MKATFGAALVCASLLYFMAPCAANTDYPVGINIPLTNTDASGKPIVVVAMCYATNDPKDIEAWVSNNSGSAMQTDIVATESGAGREAITFVVPYKWHYRVYVAIQPSNNPPPVNACKATAWQTN